MDLKQYQKFVMECPLYDDPVYGIIGELGEVIEPYKKSKRQGEKRKLLDLTNWEKEIGDVFWYLTRLAGSEGLSIENILKINMEKLTKRHNL